MGNINLLDDYKKAEAEKNNPRGLGRQKLISTGLIISLAILSLTFLVWVGAILWNRSLDSRILSIDDQIKSEESGLRGGDTSKVLDFKQRLDKIKSNTDQKKNSTKVLEKVEKSIVQGIVAEELKIDGNLLVANLNADNFGNLSKQIFNFKKADSGMKNIKVFNVMKGEKGTINFSVRSEIDNNF